MESVDIGNIKFDEKGLVPAVVQDARSGEVLMVAYMNAESLAKTVESGGNCGTKAKNQAISST